MYKRQGSVSVSVLLDKMGSLMQAPTVTQDGVCMGEEESDYLADISLLVDTQLEKTNKNLLNDDSAVQTLIIGKVKSATKSRFRIRPKVHAHIIRIAG